MRDVCNGWRVNMDHDICAMYVMVGGLIWTMIYARCM